MKRILAIGIAFAMLPVLTVKADLYPQVGFVSSINLESDEVTVQVSNGNQFQFYGIEDWFEGDTVAMIMDDNGTESVLDDEIVMAHYSSFEIK